MVSFIGGSLDRPMVAVLLPRPLPLLLLLVVPRRFTNSPSPGSADMASLVVVAAEGWADDGRAPPALLCPPPRAGTKKAAVMPRHDSSSATLRTSSICMECTEEDWWRAALLVDLGRWCCCCGGVVIASLAVLIPAGNKSWLGRKWEHRLPEKQGDVLPVRMLSGRGGRGCEKGE